MVSPRPDIPPRGILGVDEPFCDEPTPAELAWWDEMDEHDQLFERGYFDG